jgi:hypothetical protein
MRRVRFVVQSLRSGIVPSNENRKDKMAVGVVHIGWTGEVGSQLDNRRIHVHSLCLSNTMRRGDPPSLRAMDSGTIFAAGGRSVLASSLENEGER